MTTKIEVTGAGRHWVARRGAAVMSCTIHSSGYRDYEGVAPPKEAVALRRAIERAIRAAGGAS